MLLSSSKEEMKLVNILNFHKIPHCIWNPTLLNSKCQSIAWVQILPNGIVKIWTWFIWITKAILYFLGASVSGSNFKWKCIESCHRKSKSISITCVPQNTIVYATSLKQLLHFKSCVVNGEKKSFWISGAENIGKPRAKTIKPDYSFSLCTKIN